MRFARKQRGLQFLSGASNASLSPGSRAGARLRTSGQGATVSVDISNDVIVKGGKNEIL